MSAYSNVSLPPIPETVKHKTDNLDWENMPSEACELNYPATLTVTWKDYIHIFALFLLVSALFPPAAGLLGTLIAEKLTNWYWGIGAAMLGILLFAYHHRGRLQDIEDDLPPLLSWHSWGLLFGPIFLWLSIILTGRLNEPVGAFLYYGLIATPLVFVLSDLIATHAVYWLSAGLLLDHETLIRWRDDWGQRFLEDPTIPPAYTDSQDKRKSANHDAAYDTRHNYFLSVFWLIGSVLAPCLLLMILVPDPRRETIGLQIFFGLLFGLALSAWMRLQGRWDAVKQLGKCLTHWLHYGNQGPVPPWVFQSPCGPLWFRRFLTVVTVGYLAVALNSLVLGPTVHLVSTLNSTPAVSGVQNDNSNIAHSTAEITMIEALAKFTMMQWLLVGTTVFVVSFIPSMMFCLGVSVVAGPIIHAYAETLA